MSGIRVLFLGTPEFAKYSLMQLHQNKQFEVVGVVSQPDRPAGRKMKLQPSSVKAYALENNIKVITPEKIREPDVLDKIAAFQADVAVVVAYGQILPQQFLDLFPAKVVNVHGSLLPRWRGAAPIQRAIMAGDEKTGVSLQVMVKKLDAGDVIGEREISIDDSMDALTLHDELMVLGADLLQVEFVEYLQGRRDPTPQEEARVTYAEKIEKSESQIDWSCSAREIFNHIRGMKMGPGSYTQVNGKKLKIHQAVPQQVDADHPPGYIEAVDSDAITVSCGNGALKVLVVQPESKAKMSVRDYLKGYPTQPGDRWSE